MIGNPTARNTIASYSDPFLGRTFEVLEVCVRAGTGRRFAGNVREASGDSRDNSRINLELYEEYWRFWESFIILKSGVARWIWAIPAWLTTLHRV